MNRFVPSAVAAAMLLSTAAPVFAGDAATQAGKTTATTQRVVMSCANDQATRRSFARQHGAAPVFVTADQVLAARNVSEVWQTPRCMSAREHARLVDRLNTYAAVR